MATTRKKTPTKAKKAPVKKAAVKVSPKKTSAAAYTPLTWALTVAWLLLVAVFLGLIVSKLYVNN